MAVKIRLARRGRKKMAIYDVVVADARAPRDGRFIEKIGTYNPNTDPASININNDRALKWLLNGAQPTDTVKAMLSYRGVLLRKHLQIGVLKGAVTQEDADKRFEDWQSGKDAAITGKVDKLSQEKADARKKAFDAESAKNTARMDALKKKEDEAIAAAKAAEAPEVEEAPAVEETNENVSVESPANEESSPEKETETPVAEETPAVEETPAPSVAASEEVEAPAKEEAPEKAEEVTAAKEEKEIPAKEDSPAAKEETPAAKEDSVKDAPDTKEEDKA